MKTSKYDIILNYFGTFISMFSNFLILPFMISDMRSDTLGLWYVFMSIGGIVVLFDFGFNPTVARNIAYCWSGAKEIQKKGVSNNVDTSVDYRLFCSIWKTCKIIYLIVALAGLFCLMTAGSAYIYSISVHIINWKIVGAWIIYCLGIFMNLYFGYYATMLRGVGAIAQLNLSIIISRLVQLLISVIMLKMGFDILAVALGYFWYGFIYREMARRFLLKYQKIGEKIKLYFKEIEIIELKNNFKAMWYNAWRDGFVSVSTYICNQALTLILSFYYSLEQTGGYSLIVQIVTAIVTIGAALYTSYQPCMQSLYVKNCKYELKKIMSKVMVVYWGMVLCGMIILIIFGKYVITKIKPELNISVCMIVLIGIYQILLKRQTLYTSFISNMNKVTYMKAYIGFGVLSIGIAWIVAESKYNNIYLLIIVQIFVQAIFNNWYWSRYVKKYLNTNSVEMAHLGIKEVGKILL